MKKLTEATESLLDVDPAALTVKGGGEAEFEGEREKAAWVEREEKKAAKKFKEFLLHNDMNPSRTASQK